MIRCCRFLRQDFPNKASAREARLRVAVVGAVAAVSAMVMFAVGTVPVRAQAEMFFEDMNGHWAQGYVDAMAQAGILGAEAAKDKDGKPRFRPDEPVTRLDFAVWVAKAMELAPEPVGETGATVEGSVYSGSAPFTDWDSVPEEARPWVAAAVKAGLINGYPNWDDNGRSFKPAKEIRRAELAAVFGRALVQLGVKLETRYLYLFEDREDIPSWAQEAAASVQQEVIMGMPGWRLVKFAPFDSTTRAQAAAMINRFINARARLLPHKEVPQPEAPPAVVISAYYYRGAKGSYDSLMAHGRDLTHLFYFGFQLDAGGNISGFPLQRDLEAARRHGVPVLAVVTNGFNRQSTTALLGDSKARQRAVENILKLMEQGYAGVNIDFESVDVADRDRYTAFVGEVAQALRPRGYLTTVALPARNAQTAESAWGRAYDYQGIGRWADYVVVMTYDQHYAGSAPGPIGGLDWADGVMRYAASVIHPRKLLLGVPSYGRDWPEPGLAPAGSGGGAALPGEGAQANGGAQGSGGSGAPPAPKVKSRPLRDWEGNEDFYSIEELLAKYGATPQFDPATGESWFRYVDDYGVSRIVYYTDPRGLRLKLGLVDRLGLGGVAMWRMGFESPDYWGHYRAMASGRQRGGVTLLSTGR